MEDLTRLCLVSCELRSLKPKMNLTEACGAWMMKKTILNLALKKLYQTIYTSIVF